MAAMTVASGVYDTGLVFGVETTQPQVKDHSPYEREPISHLQSWMWTDMAVNQAYTAACSNCAARDGRRRFDGDRPMSTHGRGHAGAASAGSDTYEAVLQRRGAAGARRIAKPP